MIIVSQNKEVIINFKNINDIHTNNTETNREIYATANFTQYKLGGYKTEERAKEVLQEIVKTFTNKVYEMPED